jgi:hypothetical protein
MVFYPVRISSRNHGIYPVLIRPSAAFSQRMPGKGFRDEGGQVLLALFDSAIVTYTKGNSIRKLAAPWVDDSENMKKQSILLIALPMVVAACSPWHAPTPNITPSPTPPPTAVYRLDIQADASTLTVGETAAITAAIIGYFGNPMYYIEITDQGKPPPGLFISLIPGNVIHETTGESAILALVSTAVQADRVAVVLSALAPGVAEVRIGVNGEIAETDSSGRTFFNYVTKYSNGVTIKVS